jgi:hypothetical protein
MARFAAAKDRLDVMLFVVMSMSPVLQQYGSLDAKQKAGLGRAAPAAQQQPPPNASPPANAVFVNGALAVPGAPANTDTVPAKFSTKNAADDELITIASTFKTLTDDERRAIYQSLKDQPAGSTFNADIGTKMPPGIELRPVPDEVVRVAAKKAPLGAGLSLPTGVGSSESELGRPTQWQRPCYRE